MPQPARARAAAAAAIGSAARTHDPPSLRAHRPTSDAHLVAGAAAAGPGNCPAPATRRGYER